MNERQARRPSPLSALVSTLLQVLKRKQLWALLSVSLVPLIIVGVATYVASSRALMEGASGQLEAVRTNKANQLADHFVALRNQIQLFSQATMVVSAMREFQQAAPRAVEDNGWTSEELQRKRQDLQAYYQSVYTAEFRDRNPDESIESEALVAPLDDTAVALQWLYIADNQQPAAGKQVLDAAEDASQYTQLHAKYHPIMRNILDKFGLYDLFLVDVETGRIVYSVFKEVDFMTSLENGPYAGTNFAAAYRKAAGVSWNDATEYTDFEHYLPSYNEPASFIASPIYDGQERLGVAVFQMPIDRINRLLGENTGMGLTGESYAVGPDLLFRSDSRFLDELNVRSTIINRDFVVDTEAAREALAGRAGTRVIDDYRGNQVLSSWGRIKVHESYDGDAVYWAVLSEVDLDEVEAPANGLARFMTWVVATTTVLVLMLSLFLSRRFTREAQRQSMLVSGIIDNTQALASASEELTSVSQQMSAAAEQTTAQAHVVSSASEQVSHNASTVSEAIVGMSSSIQEIAESAHEAAHVANQSVDTAGTADQIIHQLAASNADIEEVVKVITMIAEQTKLLSLNAAIEAARAGDAGKGFGVVANEVKELARETAQATDRIRAKIDAIQSDSHRAVEAIGSIRQIIARINELQTTIAGAVEQQSTSVQQIQNSVGDAAEGSAEIAQNISQVADAAQSTAEGAANTQVSAQELARMAADLQQLVEKYQGLS